MSSSRPSVADKRKTFRKLHESGCFVIPNPWNIGSALYLQGLGFNALATTSSGHAHSLGMPTGRRPPDDVLAHFREMAATDAREPRSASSPPTRALRAYQSRGVQIFEIANRWPRQKTPRIFWSGM